MATSGRWAASRWRDPAVWITIVDVLAILVALSLPWSTSLVAVFSIMMLLATLMFFEVAAFMRVLRSPAGIAPFALFLLGIVGILWSDASWADCFRGINPVAKLLVLPVLFYHFERSQRGLSVFVAFLVSCALLMMVSWIVSFEPGLTLKSGGEGAARGIFVKNYIAQSQEFALCTVAMAYPIGRLVYAKRLWAALLLVAVGFGFALNMTFVIVSRTAIVTMPIMIAVLGWIHLRLRTNLMILGAFSLLAVAAWFGSPQLQSTVSKFSSEYQQYRELGAATSIAERLQYWKSGLKFFAEAPLVGHGTGSTKGLYEKAAKLPDWVRDARIFPNPHNQTLYVAIQWGVVGVIVLYAMWISHFFLFRGRGLAGWVGMAVVVQNVFTSLFNSHIFDFHEGWMYVLGVGVAGGMVLRQQRAVSQRGLACPREARPVVGAPGP